MNQSTYNERKSLSSWPCKDVDALYEKISKVGSGTYGEVNKARLRSNPNQLVALKKIKDQSETQGFPITALREISILQQCDHPNIIRLLDVASSNLPDPDSKKKKKRGSTFLVFEYMEHELLGLVQTNQFTDSQIKCMMIQILEGLEYIHKKGIIHRDIKSANILMNNKGEVKIADFGLARKLQPNFSGKLTQRVVTRWYRAPELLLGSKKYTTQIDIWALGCVFAELLMGKTHALFPAQKTPDQFAMICEKCGVPNELEWPGHKNLPYYNTMVPKKGFAKVLIPYMQKQNKNVNPLALDLLEKMLTFNPDTRITTRQALEHPYFHTSPAPTRVEEMPKFEKDCHAYVLNLKRKARVNNPKATTTIEANNVSLNKIPVQNQNITQPNITYLEPITLVPNYPTKNVNAQHNPYEQINHYEQVHPYEQMNHYDQLNPQAYGDSNTNLNGNFGMILPQLQNQNNLGNMNFINNFLNMNNMSQMNHLSQPNDVHTFNTLNNYNNLNNTTTNNLGNGNMHKLGSMHSANTFNSNSNLDTAITNMTNMSMSDLGNLSNMSNISSLSNVTNSSSANHSIPFTRQPSNNNVAMYNFMNQPHPMQDKMYLNYLNNWQYYLSMMNNAQQYYKMEQENAALASLLNNTQIPELNPTNLWIPPMEQEEKPKGKTAKPKAQSKRASNKQTNGLHNKAKQDKQDIFEKKMLETLNEINFDMFDFFKPDDSLNCKRKGNTGIQNFDELVKKSKINPLGVE